MQLSKVSLNRFYRLYLRTFKFAYECVLNKNKVRINNNQDLNEPMKIKSKYS